MKRAALLLALVAGAAPAQDVRVIDDRRAEVIAILFRIAGAPDFATGNVQPYIRLPIAIGPLSKHLEGHDLIVVIGAQVFRYYLV